MLNNATGFKKIYLATGYTDLRRGIEGLASIVRFQFHLDPYDKDTIFLFCGKRCDRIKALIWEGDGFLLCYKRLDIGAFNWPRTADLLFSVLSLRASQKSTIITSNLTFERWDEIFGDAAITSAIVDRLTYKAYLIDMEGDSYRLRETLKSNGTDFEIATK